MPFHPRIESALNRVAAFGAAATDELALLHDPAFAPMLQLSVDSIAHPRRFQEQLQRERRAMMAAAQVRARADAGADGDESQSQPPLPPVALASPDPESDDDDDGDNANDDAENRKAAAAARRIEREALRMREQLQSMSRVLLDSVQLAIAVTTIAATADAEPTVRIVNAPLLRFVLTMLSDSAVATALRVPLMQGDMPLLAYAILNHCASSAPKPAAAADGSDAAAAERNCIVFLVLDAVATMCSDSAACRLSFACCVPPICRLLAASVVPAALGGGARGAPGAASSTARPASATGAKTGAAKPPVVFVRAQPLQPSQQQQLARTAAASAGSDSAAVAPVTTADDVVFAGLAALETMLFHCADAIAAFVDSDGVAVLAALYRQGRDAELSSTKAAPSVTTATEPVAFIKRVLVHCRLSNAVDDARWAALLDGLGRPGASIPVDELRWTLRGCTKLPSRMP
jgi:hypothetical protein